MYLNDEVWTKYYLTSYQLKKIKEASENELIEDFSYIISIREYYKLKAKGKHINLKAKRRRIRYIVKKVIKEMAEDV